MRFEPQYVRQIGRVSIRMLGAGIGWGAIAGAVYFAGAEIAFAVFLPSSTWSLGEIAEYTMYRALFLGILGAVVGAFVGGFVGAIGGPMVGLVAVNRRVNPILRTMLIRVIPAVLGLTVAGYVGYVITVMRADGGAWSSGPPYDPTLLEIARNHRPFSCWSIGRGLARPASSRQRPVDSRFVASIRRRAAPPRLTPQDSPQ